MSAIRESYAKIIDPYNKLKPFFKWNRTLTSIEKDFGGAEGLAALKKSGLSEKTLKEISAFKTSKKILDASKKAAFMAGALGLGSYAIGRIGEQAVPQAVK
jgi:hypothetical protein